jgi:hypothetical protein
MFSINYNIIRSGFEEIEFINDDQIRYDFLLGGVVFNTGDYKIFMDWDWIPLLDFSICLSDIVKNLSLNGLSNGLFEFTESAETIKFSRNNSVLKITCSFTEVVLDVSFKEFAEEIKRFNNEISIYIREHVEPHKINNTLNKYL